MIQQIFLARFFGLGRNFRIVPVLFFFKHSQSSALLYFAFQLRCFVSKPERLGVD